MKWFLTKSLENQLCSPQMHININNQINLRFTPAIDLKIGTFVLVANFQTQKGISKNYNHSEKDPTK